MIFLDTSIPVYAVGGEHLLQGPCRRVLTACAEGVVDAATSVEVIQEFAHVRARRRSRADAVDLASHFAVALTVLPTGTEDLRRGLALFERLPRLGPSTRCWPPWPWVRAPPPSSRRIGPSEPFPG